MQKKMKILGINFSSNQEINFNIKELFNLKKSSLTLFDHNLIKYRVRIDLLKEN